MTCGATVGGMAKRKGSPVSGGAAALPLAATLALTAAEAWASARADERLPRNHSTAATASATPSAPPTSHRPLFARPDDDGELGQGVAAAFGGSHGAAAGCSDGADVGAAAGSPGEGAADGCWGRIAGVRTEAGMSGIGGSAGM